MEKIRSLYEDDTVAAHRFRYGVLVFDIATILFVIGTSFYDHTVTIEIIDAVFGVLILTDFFIRFWIEKEKRLMAFRLATWADVAAVLSFLAPITGEGVGFLRILRTLRLLHTYQLLSRLRQDFSFFRKNEDIVLASLNLGVFLFVMTGLIYATQVNVNPEIRNYADALYFTVTTLTTTGFGDITLTGPWGRMLSVGVMIFGVTLFLRLLQVLFRPSKVRQECKTCGETIYIRTEGDV